VKRVAGYDTVMPLPKLEAQYMPSADDVVAAVLDVMRFR
jgi:pyruvate/2-oxoglutarate/acetoin dehydrogenase E1 component